MSPPTGSKKSQISGMVVAGQGFDAHHMITQTHTHSSRCWWIPDPARWVCNIGTGPAADHDGTATRLPAGPLVDVRDMIVVHTALLREFRLAPAAVARVGTGAAKHAAVVDRHLGFLCDLLHHHHEGEDALLWPLLRDRVNDAAVEFVNAVESQHLEIDAALRAVMAARNLWVPGTGKVHQDSLVGELKHLYALLKAHLDLEESAVLPLAASVLTDAEWHAIGDAAAAAMPKPALMLAFGMFA
jgi:hemerythrin-like domain-containing protein